MKNLLFILLALLACCKDVGPAPEPNEIDYSMYIRGEWEAYAPTKPKWKWSFGEDSARQYLPGFGTVLADLRYYYEVQGDIASLGKDSVIRLLTLTAINDTILEVYEPGNAPENTRYFLKRQ